jgi:hypothetical protein
LNKIESRETNHGVLASIIHLGNEDIITFNVLMESLIDRWVKKS